jgi:hypothetical protein
LVHPGGVIRMVIFTSDDKVSGFGCQVSETHSARYVGVAHKMGLLSPVLTFSCNQIGVHDSGFGIY